MQIVAKTPRARTPTDIAMAAHSVEALLALFVKAPLPPDGGFRGPITSAQRQAAPSLLSAVPSLAGAMANAQALAAECSERRRLEREGAGGAAARPAAQTGN